MLGLLHVSLNAMQRRWPNGGLPEKAKPGTVAGHHAQVGELGADQCYHYWQRVVARRSAGCAGVAGGDTMNAYHADKANPEVLLSRSRKVKQVGAGRWRINCGACDTDTLKVAVAEVGDRVLVHAFCAHSAEEVLAAVGLRFADLYPPRHWPQSPQEREAARRAICEAGIVSAVEVLGLEACVIEAAGRQLQRWQCLNVEDDARLSVAVERVSNARNVLTRPQPWRASV